MRSSPHETWFFAELPDAGAFERLLPFVNAGEESTPRVTDLSPIGFPGEDAWLDQDFCGALGGDEPDLADELAVLAG